MSLPRYPEYKHSDIEWLKEVPAHWEVAQLKRVLDIQNGADHKSVEADDGYPVIGSGGPFTYASEFIYDGESVLLGRKGTVDRPLYVTGRFWTVDTMYWTKVSADAYGRFCYYAALTIPFNYYSTNTALPSMTKGVLSAHPIALPPYDEQHAIATFLDHETAKIDALIAEQEKLLALLAEKRQATISHAVTRGLTNLPGADLNAAFGGGPKGEGKDSPSHPNAPMKESGIPWLGEVPAHWEVVRIKHVISSIEQGWSPQCDNYPAETSDEWGVLKVGCVNGGVFMPSENKRLPDELEPMPQYAVRQGDLLISRANTRDLVGGAAVVTEDHPKLLLCDKLYRLRMDGACCISEFLAALLGAGGARSQIELQASGASSSMLNIGQSVILDMPFALPPVEEQFRIVDFITTERRRLDELQRESKHAIDLLKERRSALIAAAVTGKIDVRSSLEATIA